MAETMPDDLTDAKIAAAEARTDTKFARFEGKIDLIAADLKTSISTLNVNLALLWQIDWNLVESSLIRVP